MKSRNTIFLFLVTALMIGGFFWAKEKVPSTEETLIKGKHVLDFKVTNVLELKIKGVGQDFEFERQNQKWILKKPIQARANHSEVEGCLSTLEYLELRRKISPKDLADAKLSKADYGLEKPRLTATLKTKQNEKTLYLGNEAKQGDGLYIQVDSDPNIYLVDKDIANRLGKKLDEYRERMLFDFSVAQVQRLEVKNGAKVIEFAKTNNLWRIVQPLSTRADSQKVDHLIRQIANLRVETFLSEELSAAKEYGLEDPVQEVTVKLSQSEVSNTLLFGQQLKGDDAKIAVKIKGQNSIFAIPSSYSAEVAKPLTEFRNRNLGAFNPADVTEIEVKNRSIVTLLKKDLENWMIIEPEKQDADKELIELFLSKLNSIQIKEFTADVVTDLDKYGLKTPLSSIVLRGKKTETDGQKVDGLPIVLNLLIGKEDTVKKLSYVKLPDESSVYGIDLVDSVAFPKSSIDLRSRMIFQIKKETLKSCTQKRSNKIINTLEYSSEGNWKIAEESQGVIDETAWLKFQNQLEYFNVEKIVGTALNKTVKEYGLDVPIVSLTLNVQVDGKPVVYEILVGRETSQKKHFILWKDQLLVCQISEEMYRILSSDWLLRSPSK